jgi:uncharacterized protein YhhL (DUF1145 family)
MNLIYRMLTFFPTSLRFFVWVLSGFASVISFFQINSYWADHHHANWIWWTSGFVFGIFALGVFVLYLIESHSYRD